MKTVRIIRLILLLSICSFLTSQALASRGTQIADYDAEFTPVQEGATKPRDMLATLKVIFVTDQLFDSEIRILNKINIENITVRDEKGPIPFTVKNTDGKTIRFGFNRLTSRKKTVYVSFVIKDAIEDNELYSRFDLDLGWAQFIEQERYRIALPGIYKDVKTDFPTAKITDIGGRTVIEFSQAPHGETPIRIGFAPNNIVDELRTEFEKILRSLEFAAFFTLSFMLIVACIFLAAMSLLRSRWRAAQLATVSLPFSAPAVLHAQIADTLKPYGFSSETTPTGQFIFMPPTYRRTLDSIENLTVDYSSGNIAIIKGAAQTVAKFSQNGEVELVSETMIPFKNWLINRFAITMASFTLLIFTITFVSGMYFI